MADCRVERPEKAAFLLFGSIDGFDNFDHDFGYAFFEHVEFFCGAYREIEDAAFYEGHTVVDFEDDGFAVAEVSDADNGAQGEFAMGGRQTVHVEDFATGGGASVELVGIVGGVANLVGFVLLAFVGIGR